MARAEKGKSGPQFSDTSGWEAEKLRLTAFPVEELREIKNLAPWKALIHERPRGSTFDHGVLVEHGIYKEGILGSITESGRIQWDFFADPEKKPDEFVSLGAFSEALAAFRPLMNRWLKSSPPVKRLAFGAVLVQPQKSVLAANRRISDFISGVDLRGASADFSYRVNRPRKSIIKKGLMVNRLSTWAVNEQRKISIGLRLPTEATRQKQRVISRLELDINTSRENREPLPKSRLQRLFRELMDLGVEIAERGDIR